MEMLACYSDFHGTTDTKLTGLRTEAAKVGCQPLFLSETLWFTENSIINRKAVPSPFTQREFLIPQSGRIDLALFGPINILKCFKVVVNIKRFFIKIQIFLGTLESLGLCFFMSTILWT